MSAHDDGVSRGTGEQRAPAHDWEYQLQTDLYRCRRCGAEALKEAATWPGECVNVPDSQPEQEAAVISAAAAVAIARHVADDPRLSVAQRVAARDWCKERGLVLRTREEWERVIDELETERMRLAACGVAALGYFTGCKDEYRSASLDDVLRLLAELERLRKGLMPGSAHRNNAALLTRAPELEHRMGFGDAGRER